MHFVSRYVFLFPYCFFLFLLPTVLQSYKLQVIKCKDTKNQRLMQVLSNIFLTYTLIFSLPTRPTILQIGVFCRMEL
nr:MAG TPA_asm: hypothetical protein [Caudoviricetes sp.]